MFENNLYLKYNSQFMYLLAIKMRSEVEPSEVSSVLKFSPSSYSSQINDNIETTYGLISKSKY